MQPNQIENEVPKEQRADREPQPCWTAPRAKIYSIETTQNTFSTHYTGTDGGFGCLS